MVLMLGTFRDRLLLVLAALTLSFVLIVRVALRVDYTQVRTINSRLQRVINLLNATTVRVAESALANNSSSSSSSSSSALGTETAGEECYCYGELMCFEGAQEAGEARYGRAFDCALYGRLAEHKLLYEHRAQTFGHHQALAGAHWQPVFVTAANSTRFGELRTLVASIRAFYPRATIRVYDLGLHTQDLDEIHGWCNVETQWFDFSLWPPHVANFENSAYKIILIDAIQTYSSFFYFDTSILLQSARLVEFVQAVQDGQLMPLSIHVFSRHSVYNVTAPGLGVITL